MKLLLDTHIILRWVIDPSLLSDESRALIEDEVNELFLSVVSVWEIQIKHQLGKLDLIVPLDDLVRIQQQNNNLNILPGTLPHVLALDLLPFHHKDPFDRLLIAQSIQEDFALVTRDADFSRYPVRLVH